MTSITLTVTVCSISTSVTVNVPEVVKVVFVSFIVAVSSSPVSMVIIGLSFVPLITKLTVFITSSLPETTFIETVSVTLSPGFKACSSGILFEI
ncbi:hypothetical protein ARCL110784_12580 [Arcobacter cloacae]